MPVFVRQLSHFQQCLGLIGLQPQCLVKQLHRQRLVAHGPGGQAQVLEHPRALRIQGIVGGFLKGFVSFLIPLLLVQETAVVVEGAGIFRAAGQRFLEILLGQLGLKLGLEHQPQGAVGLGVGAVDFQRLLERHLGLFGLAGLQVADTQLDQSLARFFASLAGFHRVDFTRGNATNQQVEEQ